MNYAAADQEIERCMRELSVLAEALDGDQIEEQERDARQARVAP